MTKEDLTRISFPINFTRGRFAEQRLPIMLMTIVVTAVLGGIAGLVAFGAICEGIGCTKKLRDRYHE